MRTNFQERLTDPKLFYSTDTTLRKIMMPERKQQGFGQNYIIRSFIICTPHNVVKPRRITRMGLESSMEELHTESYSGKIHGRDTLIYSYLVVNWRIML
jgi:hypothetical protein